MKSRAKQNTSNEFENLFIEIKVHISFSTNFLFGYTNEFKEEKIVELNGTSYSREIFYRESSLEFFCMLFVNNINFEENQKAQIFLYHNNLLIKQKLFHLSNTNPYDGWFILEKKIFAL